MLFSSDKIDLNVFIFIILRMVSEKHYKPSYKTYFIILKNFLNLSCKIDFKNFNINLINLLYLFDLHITGHCRVKLINIDSLYIYYFKYT